MRKTIATLALLSASLTIGFAQEKVGSIHGHIQDPLGNPIPNATVTVSTDGKDAKYTFTADANGDYKGTGIAPGTYFLNLSQATKPIDQLLNVKIVADTDETENFDLSRPDYIAKLTPEQRKAMEEVKAKNAEAMKANGVIKNLNADLATARADNKAKNYAEAETLMTKDAALKPDAAVIWLELANAQAGQKKWPDATTSYQKVITLETANPKPNADVIAGANNGLGEALASQSKLDDAKAAYEAAAKANPPGAAMYYTNETIILSRAGQPDATAEAADKAIAADPTKPIPYYLKGQALIGKATVDKAGKIVAPPGCVEAYQKYLELAPDGQFAKEVTDVLTGMGQTIKSSYKAKKGS
jgi:tetratricopeptide (TPR) repeat protein